MWIILLDRSDSMGRPFSGGRAFSGRTRTAAAATKLEAAKQAIAEHLRGLGSPASVVLIGFNDTAQVRYVGPSTASSEIERVLQPIEAGGGTSIATALTAAAGAVDDAVSERLFRILVVTDGEDDLAAVQPPAAALGQRGAVIDVTLIDPTPHGEEVARAIARHGIVSAVASAEELGAEVGRARMAQEEQQAGVQELIAQHERERVQLAQERPIEERLAFTVAYPPVVGLDHWYPFVAYLHLAGLQSEVERAIREDARIAAGGPSLSLARSSRGVVRGTLVTLTPRIEGLHFNPPTATVAWFEDIQDVRFRFRAPAAMAERSAAGEVEITVGSLPIAHVGVVITARTDPEGASGQATPPGTAGLYQDVFASYSSRDAAIVQACRAVYWGLGIHLAVDRQILRAGQEWDPALRAIIEKCDLFQLFWSEAASASIPVRNEYEFALGQVQQKGSGFIRPVVWELTPPPIPADLKRFHFAPLDLTWLARLGHLPLAADSAKAARPPSSGGRVPATAVPLLVGAAPDLVQSVREDLSEVVRFLEETSGLRYYPVPTLLVDEHVVRSVRASETVDLGPVDPGQIDLAHALQQYLLAVGLEFHVRRLVREGWNGLPPDAYARRFGAGRLVTAEQFEWLRVVSEGFPEISDALGVRARAAMRQVRALIERPELDLDLAGLIALVLEFGARAIEGADPQRGINLAASMHLGDRDVEVESHLAEGFERAGGTLLEGRRVPVRGPASSYAALLRATAEGLQPLLPAVQGHDSFRSDAPPPEAARAAAMAAAADAVLRAGLPYPHPLRSPADLATVRGWIADRLDPRWRRIGSELAAQGFAGPGRPDTLRAVLHQFLGVIRRLLDEALRTGGDFELTFGYEVPEPAWVRLVTDLGDHHLAIAGRHDRTRGPEVQLAGRFSDFVALYRAAAERLVNLTASPPRERSVTERVFVELTPTFGIFAPARSETTDHQLYRWAAEQGVAQALTLPGADRVLLCLGAADRFARTLLEGAGDPAQARRAGALFQRCVLVHEHCHAMLACALDAEGRNASGPDRPDSWARARALNEALAVWMELHHVRGDAAMEQLVWKYIGAGTYPEWPYAGASRLEAQFADQGIEAIRGWIARLRQVPEMAQEDFDRVALAP